MPSLTSRGERRSARRSESPSAADIKPRRRPKVADLRWLVVAVGALLVVQVLRTPDLRLHLVTGASLTQGALISAIALGVVLTYRGSGVVNFATGATAMYAAYVYTGLRTDGTLFLPPVPNPLALVEGGVHLLGGSSDFHLPSVPTEISFGAPLTFPTALGLSLVFCVLMGLALHFLVFRPLRTAPPLAKVVASVGVLLLLQAIIVRRFGTAARATLLGHGTPKQVKLPFSVRMNTEQLLVIGIVIALTVMLSALFRFTRFGIATRAAAENEKGAMLLGFSPDFLAGNNWVLSTVISGLLGILVAGNQKSVDPVTITLLIVPALSVALVGGLTSFGITVAAAFGLAMTQALIPYLGASRTWYPQAGGQALPGVAALLPFLLIVGVMFVNGHALPTRGSVSAGRLPKVANPTLFTTRVVAPLAVAGCAVELDVLRDSERPARDHHIAHRHRDQPVVRGHRRLRRPDLARANDARRHQRVHTLEAHDDRRTSTRTHGHPHVAVPDQPARRRARRHGRRHPPGDTRLARYGVSASPSSPSRSQSRWSNSSSRTPGSTEGSRGQRSTRPGPSIR